MLQWRREKGFRKLNKSCELGVSGSIAVSKTDGVGSIPTVHAK